MTDNNNGQLYFFSIAIDEYKHIDNLTVAIKSAADFKDILKKKYGFLDENILELHNQDATRQNIIHYLRSFSLGLTENDSLIVFYSGHGVIDEWTKEGYWIPASASEDDMSSWISNHEIKKYMQSCKAQHILLLCDSFFYGDFLKKYEPHKAITQEMLTHWYIQKSVQFIFSGKTPFAPDKSFEGRSPFVHFLIESLVETKQESLIASVLFSNLCARCADKDVSLPFFNILISEEETGEYFFFAEEADEKTKIVITSVNQKIGNIEEEIQTIENKKLLHLQSEIHAAQGKVKLGVPKDLDNVIKMFKEKEHVETEIIELKKIKEQLRKENTQRIEKVQLQKVDEVQKRLILEVEKYNLFVSSELCNNDIKSKAWSLVVRQCPDWWRAKEVEEHNVDMLLQPPHEREQAPEMQYKIPEEFGYSMARIYSCGGKEFQMEEYIHEETGIAFVLIPHGTFVMGGNRYDWEKPERYVHVKPFLMSQYIITQKVWEQVMGSNPSFFKGEDRPAESISWELSNEFCQKTNLSLPSESQWEYATRAHTTTNYYWGEEMKDEYCWYGDNSDEQTHNVGEKYPNAFGLYDTLGNVWEWCLDTWHPNYENAPTDDQPWIDKEELATRVIRGGSFYYIAEFCRSAYRGRIAANRGNRFLSFRVVYNLQ